MTSCQCLDEAQPITTPTSRKDYLSHGARPKTTNIETSSQTKVSNCQTHSAPNRSPPATSDPKQHRRNPKSDTSTAFASEPVRSLVQSVGQTGMAPISSQNTRMELAAMPQGNLMPGSPNVQVNVMVHMTGQTSDRSQRINLYESQAFPQLLLDSLQPLDLEDWKLLASHLKLDKFIGSIDCNVRNHGQSATQLLMDKWWQSRGRNADMFEIKDALTKMTRIDVLDEFRDALEEWESQNN